MRFLLSSGIYGTNGLKRKYDSMKTCCQKKEELKKIILSKLASVLDSDYWLFGFPWFPNVGDMLIFQGELDFLRSFSYKCKGVVSSDSVLLPRLSPGDLVLFNGGGNFGDLWPRAPQFRMSVMRENPKCRYLVFPQTICYADEYTMCRDAAFFGQYNCTICARDEVSYELFRKYFSNDILLLPDMAFCIDMKRWMPKREKEHREISRSLVMKRGDAEYKPSVAFESLMEHDDSGNGVLDIADWSAMTQDSLCERIKKSLHKRRKRLRWLYDWYMFHFYRPYLIKSGVSQLSRYKSVYTTRLHACILGVLLEMDNVVLYDNSYGKNSSFYETWLYDLDNVTLKP